MEQGKKMEKKPTCVVAHPMQQHSYHTAQALVNAHLLDSYITTVYYDNNKFIYKILGKLLGKKNIKRMRSKRIKNVSVNVKTFCELRGLIYLLLLRIDKKKIILTQYYKYLTKVFGKKVAKYCKQSKINILIMYDTTAYYAFNELKKSKPSCKLLLDMSSIPTKNICKIIEEEARKIGKMPGSMRLRFKTAKLLQQNSKSEIELSDVILCGSTFPQDCIKEDYPYKRCFVIPYGVDKQQFIYKKRSEVKNRKVSFVYVGGVEMTKGSQYLLKAWDELNTDEAILKMVGDCGYAKNELVSKSNIQYIGFVLKENMPSVYHESDVYIIPSLYEGFSQSLIEAMSCGLPVIATECSGAKMVVKNGVNGFIVRPADVNELKDKIQWIIENKDALPKMGEKASISVENLTWDNYGKGICETVMMIYGEENSVI